MIRTLLIASTALLASFCRSDGTLDPKLENLGRATGPVTPTPPRSRTDAPPLHGMDETPVAPSAPVDKAPKLIKGQVLETIDVTRYTYIHLKSEEGEPLWAAVPKTPLKKGKSVEIVQSLVMTDFESKTLNRTFPTIVFGVLHQLSAEPEPPQEENEPEDAPK
jgi:hypothetical protein